MHIENTHVTLKFNGSHELWTLIDHLRCTHVHKLFVVMCLDLRHGNFCQREQSWRPINMHCQQNLVGQECFLYELGTHHPIATPSRAGEKRTKNGLSIAEWFIRNSSHESKHEVKQNHHRCFSLPGKWSSINCFFEIKRITIVCCRCLIFCIWHCFWAWTSATKPVAGRQINTSSCF